jgi:flagellar biosynthesis/type III secretory pathway chaperone
MRLNLVLYKDNINRDIKEGIKVIIKDLQLANAINTLIVIRTFIKLNKVYNIVKQFSKAIKSRKGRKGQVV